MNIDDKVYKFLQYKLLYTYENIKYIIEDNFDLFKEIIEIYPNLFDKSEELRKLLQEFLENKHFYYMDIIKLLIKNKANLDFYLKIPIKQPIDHIRRDIVMYFDYKLIEYIMYLKEYKLLKLLLKNGLKIGDLINKKYYPGTYQSWIADKKIIKLLVKHGLDLNKFYDSQTIIFRYRLERDNDYKYILKYGANPNITNINNDSIFQNFHWIRDPKQIKKAIHKFLKYGAKLTQEMYNNMNITYEILDDNFNLIKTFHYYNIVKHRINKYYFNIDNKYYDLNINKLIYIYV